MANKHIKRYSTLLIIRKMQIITTIRYHFKPIRMVFIKNKQIKLKTSVGKDMEKLVPLCIAHGNIK